MIEWSQPEFWKLSQVLGTGLRPEDSRGRLSPRLRDSVAMTFHPTAILDSSAKVHASCKIGPYCTIGASVELGEACELISHVAIEGPSKIGARRLFAASGFLR